MEIRRRLIRAGSHLEDAFQTLVLPNRRILLLGLGNLAKDNQGWGAEDEQDFVNKIVELYSKISPNIQKAVKAHIRDYDRENPNDSLDFLFSVFTKLSNKNASKAMTSDKLGGISLDAAQLNMDVKRDGEGVAIPVGAGPIGADFDGLEPQILGIRTLTSVDLAQYVPSRLPTAEGMRSAGPSRGVPIHVN